MCGGKEVADAVGFKEILADESEEIIMDGYPDDRTDALTLGLPEANNEGG